MIDFVKCIVYNEEVIRYFRTHPLLDWISTIDKFNQFDKEVINSKMKRTYDGFDFIFYGNRLEIQFMPHCRFNGGSHNSNDFSMAECMIQIRAFRDIFGVDLRYFPVVNLEYGVNVLAPSDVQELLYLMVAHGKNEFKNDVDLLHSRRSYYPDKHGKANQYKAVKMYAKAFQKGSICHPDTLRFEIKSRMAKFIKRLGIETMADLLDPEVYATLAESLIAEFDNILMIDNTVNFQRLSDGERKQLQGYLNPMRWHDVLNARRNLFALEKKKYNSLVEKANGGVKASLAKVIQAKVYELTDAAVA